jgi:AcrR family transcriptional regulator
MSSASARRPRPPERTHAVDPIQDGPPGNLDSVRLSRAERRDALLDAAVALVTSGELAAVSMETVAERAGVSRPLVYKHFANRHDLLAAVYRREAVDLHRRLAAEVVPATSLEDMYRRLIRGALRAAGERGHVFAALRAAGGWDRELRHEQRARDAETVRAFSKRAARELGINRREATAATATLLACIDPVLGQWRLRPTPEHASLLEEIYIGMVDGVFDALRGKPSSR